MINKSISNRAKWQIFFWIGFTVLMFSGISSHQKFFNVTALDADLFDGFAINPQKMFFNNALLFALFIHIRKDGFLVPEYMMRYERSGISTVWFSSGVNSLIFSVGIYAALIFTALCKQFTIDWSILLHSFELAAFFLKLNAIYVFIYVLTEKYVYSFFFIVLESLTIIIAFIGLGFVNVDISGFIAVILNPIYLIILSVIFLTASSMIIRKRDFI